ncbi:hypothetical protein, partial [Salmonella enterica]|uniref:hypothetical protein n=1 Tax=Salmonella enterica TaxID=28901 RepID=UPI003D2972E5
SFPKARAILDFAEATVPPGKVDKRLLSVREAALAMLSLAVRSSADAPAPGQITEIARDLFYQQIGDALDARSPRVRERWSELFIV